MAVANAMVFHRFLNKVAKSEESFSCPLCPGRLCISAFDKFDFLDILDFSALPVTLVFDGFDLVLFLGENTLLPMDLLNLVSSLLLSSILSILRSKLCVTFESSLTAPIPSMKIRS